MNDLEDTLKFCVDMANDRIEACSSKEMRKLLGDEYCDMVIEEWKEYKENTIQRYEALKEKRNGAE